MVMDICLVNLCWKAISCWKWVCLCDLVEVDHLSAQQEDVCYLNDLVSLRDMPIHQACKPHVGKTSITTAFDSLFLLYSYPFPPNWMRIIYPPHHVAQHSSVFFFMQLGACIEHEEILLGP
jgi:hypothetical protein